MKKILSILLLISSFGYSQTLLKLKAIETATAGAGQTVITNTAGTLGFVPEQTLTVSGNSLSISRGNTVTISTNTTNLVPYTGATSDVDLGNYGLNAKTFNVKGTAGNGHIGLKHQSANITAATSESSLGADASGNPVWKNDGNTIQYLALTNSLTSNYIPIAVSSTSLSDSPIHYSSSIVNVDANLSVNNGDLGFSSTYGLNSQLLMKGNNDLNWKGYYPNPLTTPTASQQASHIKLYDDGSNFFGIGLNTSATIDGVTPLSSLNIASNQTGHGVISMFTSGLRRLLIKDNGDIKIYQNLNLDNTTANSLIYSDGSKNLASITLGNGLSLSSGTLTATGTGSTTTITAGTNVSVSGSAPAYTVSAASPTITAGSNMSVTTSGLSYTVAATTQTAGLASTSSPTITSPTFSTSSTYSYATASTVPIFNASKQLISSSTTTTELTYLAGVTSSVQTQLDSKLSSTKERLLMIGGFAITNPADAQNYYFGEYPDAVPQTSQSIYKFQFNENVTITRVLITVKQVTNPTNESVSFYLRASATTDQTITTSMDMSTIGASSTKVFTYSGLNLTGTSGTDYELKMLTPTWATNPTSTTIRVKIYGY